MDKLDALNELKAAIDKGLVKYSDYSDIIDAVTGMANNENIAKAKVLLTDYVDNNVISFDAYVALKTALASVAPTPSSRPVSQPSNVTVKAGNPNASLHGTATGVLLTLFLGFIGLLLCVLMGDEECKSASIKTIIISAIVGAAIGLIAIIVCLVIVF